MDKIILAIPDEDNYKQIWTYHDEIFIISRQTVKMLMFAFLRNTVYHGTVGEYKERIKTNARPSE